LPNGYPAEGAARVANFILFVTASYGVWLRPVQRIDEPQTKKPDWITSPVLMLVPQA